MVTAEELEELRARPATQGSEMGDRDYRELMELKLAEDALNGDT